MVFSTNQWIRAKASPAFFELCGVGFLETQRFSLFWNQVLTFDFWGLTLRGPNLFSVRFMALEIVFLV